MCGGTRGHESTVKKLMCLLPLRFFLSHRPLLSTQYLSVAYNHTPVRSPGSELKFSELDTLTPIPEPQLLIAFVPFNILLYNNTKVFRYVSGCANRSITGGKTMDCRRLRNGINIAAAYLALIVICALCAGCVNQKPLTTGVGEPIGTAVSAVIGPEGGELSSKDGRLSMLVPPGAVTEDTTFSIQPITSLAPTAINGGRNFFPAGQPHLQHSRSRHRAYQPCRHQHCLSGRRWYLALAEQCVAR
jgi:hypothetical protein